MTTEPGEALQRIDVLHGMALFGGLLEGDLHWLAGAARLSQYATGDAVLHQGDPALSLRVVARGRVRVVERAPERPGIEIELAMLGPGEVVGEMEVLDDVPCAATVVAVEPTTTLELPATVLRVVIRRYPTVAAALLRTLSQRLRSANHLARRLAEAAGERSGSWTG